MQNHLKISSKSQFWIQNMRNWTKTLTLDMSGPAKASPGGQVLVSKADSSFFLLRKINFPSETKVSLTKIHFI